MWRTVLTLLISYGCAFMFVLEIRFILGLIPHNEETINAYTVGIPGLFIIFLVVLFIGYWVGKRQAARRNR